MSHMSFEKIFTLRFPETQPTCCSEQERYLKFHWLQRDLNLQSLSV